MESLLYFQLPNVVSLTFSRVPYLEPVLESRNLEPLTVLEVRNLEPLTVLEVHNLEPLTHLEALNLEPLTLSRRTIVRAFQLIQLFEAEIKLKSNFELGFLGQQAKTLNILKILIP